VTTPDGPPQDEPAATAAPDGTPETGAEAQPATGVDAKADAETGPAAKAEPAHKPDAKADARPEAEATPAAQPAPKGATQPQAPEAAPKADTRPEAQPAPKADSPAEPEIGTAAAIEAEPPRRRPRYRWLRILAACTALLVLALGAGAWYVYRQLNGNITTDATTESQLKAQAASRPAAGPTKAENILLIGSDNRGNGNQQYGVDTGTQRSDTTILLHLAADGGSATAVSIPRDLMAHVPACTAPDGSTVSARFEQFNWAFQMGGAACTIRTVENMTGIRIDHHLIVDFTGFKKMVDAVGGVDVCVPNAVHDPLAHLDLPAGLQKLNGEQALGYVRARETLGDGSDTQRMQRQQDFLASLVKKVRSNGVLLNPVKLYPLLSAATSSLTADPGLDSLTELYGLAHRVQQTPTGAIRFLTLPQEPYAQDHNRDQLIQPAADQLFTALRDDQVVRVSGDTPTGSPTGSPTAPAPGTGSPATTGTGPATGGPAATPTAAPTFHGTTANRAICGKDQ
jgi:LCP family protein required for cell wall assembly